MGYRSEVLLAVAGPKEMMLTEVSTLLLVARSELTRACLNEMLLVENGKNELALYLYGDEWKWHSGFEDVDEFMRIFHHFKALSEKAEAVGEGDSFYGILCRIGEDSNDTEAEIFGHEFGDPWGLGEISRSIVVNLGTKDVRHNLGPSDTTKTI